MSKLYKTILLDQDGVMGRFSSASVKATNKHLDRDDITIDDVVEMGSWGFYELWDITEDEWWTAMNADPTFWYDIEPFPWARQLYDDLHKYCDEVLICTSPPSTNTGTAAKQKFEWLVDKLTIPVGNIFVGKKKYAFSSPHNMLVDDYASNVLDFIRKDKRGGDAVVVPSDWNTAPDELTFDLVWQTIEQHMEYKKEKDDKKS